MSTLSVLLLVNDSELEDAGGSIGVGSCWAGQAKEEEVLR
jgi:hypothetical protein